MAVPAFQGNSNSPLPVDLGRAAGFGLCFWIAVTGPSAAPGAEYTFGTHAKAIYDSQNTSKIFPATVANKSGTIIPAYISAPPQYPEPRAPQIQQAVFFKQFSNPGLGILGSEYTFGTHAKALYDSQAGAQFFPTARTPPLPVPIAGPTYVQVQPQLFDYTLQGSFPFVPVATGWLVTVISSGPQLVDLTLQPAYSKTISKPLILGPTVRPISQTLPQFDPTQPPARIFTPPTRSVPGMKQPFISNVPVDPTQLSAQFRPTVLAGSAKYVQPTFVKSFNQTYNDQSQRPAVLSAPVPTPPVPPVAINPGFFAIPEQAYFNIPYSNLSAPIVQGIPYVPPQPGGGRARGRIVLEPKKLGETLTLGIDFISALGPNETIVSAICQCSVYTGNDSNPGAVLNGPAVVTGTIVNQSVRAGNLGTIYDILAQASTSLGQVLELSGYLAVVPDLP